MVSSTDFTPIRQLTHKTSNFATGIRISSFNLVACDFSTESSFSSKTHNRQSDKVLNAVDYIKVKFTTKKHNMAKNSVKL